MRKLLLAGAAALAFAGAPHMLAAQTLTTDQQANYQSWPTDQRTAYDAWPTDLRTYYWTLNPNQQQGWWRLTDEQRSMVYNLTPEQRTAAWQSIESQMAGQPASAVPGATGESMNSGSGNMQSGSMSSGSMPSGNSMNSGSMSSGGNMAPPPGDAMNRSYPVCSRTVQDSCQNPGEGGAKGRSRALPYWPGESRTESRGR